MRRPSSRPRPLGSSMVGYCNTCHVPGCNAACPPQYLMCRTHWFMVPTTQQQRVNDTVWKRRNQVDASWADWWRAKTDAIASVLRRIEWGDDKAIAKFEIRGESVATLLEGSET